MNRRALLAFLLLLIFVFPCYAQDGDITETFDDPSLSGWEYSPGVSVVDGVLRVSAPGFAHRSGGWMSRSLSVQVRRSGRGELILNYRFTDAGTYNLIIGSDELILNSRWSGQITELGRAQVAVPADEWFEIGVTVTGGQHVISLNTEPVLTVTLPGLDLIPPGGIVFRAEGDAVGEFDNLVMNFTPQESGEPGPQVEAPTPQPGQTANIVYAVVEGIPLLLDVYPAETPGPHPVIVFVHGGAFQGGDKEGGSGFDTALNELGFTTFSINYRLAPEFPFPAAVTDVQCAVRWIREHATQYDVDPNRVVLMGASAGAHLSALAGLSAAPSAPPATWEPSCGDPATDLQVQGIISLYGSVDFVYYAVNERGAGHAVAGAFLGTSCEGSPPPDVCVAASPLTYVSTGAPPTLLIHGTADVTVSIANSEHLYEALQAVGADVTLLPVEGAGHGFDETQSPMVMETIQQFLTEKVSSESPPPG